VKLTLVLLVWSSQALADPKPDPCSADALKLKAKALAPWKLPERCTARTSARGVLKTKAELDGAFECEKGVSLGVDLAKSALVRVPWMMSPAAAGLIAYDDGTLITLVTKFRQPCPNDPHAMPIGLTNYYLLPAGAARDFAETNCTLPKQCP
jgi:hypothetical protein